AEAAIVFGTAERRELETLTPIGRRSKFLTRAPVGPELVVRGPLFGVLQYLVGFLDFLEPILGVRLFAHVRVMFPGEPAICALDFLLARVAGDPQDLVVVLVIHSLELGRPTTKSRYRSERARRLRSSGPQRSTPKHPQA